MRSRWMTAVAVLALVAAPTFAAEETVKQKPAADPKAEKADASKAAKPAEGAPAADPAACKPTATRVNTLEDLFGTRDWSALVARSAAAAPGSDGAVLWRDATAEAQATGAPAAGKPVVAAKPAAKPAQPAPAK